MTSDHFFAFMKARQVTTPTPGPGDAMSPEYWDAVLRDPLADASPEPPGPPVRTLRLSEISQHILRVGCRRCGRTEALTTRAPGTNARNTSLECLPPRSIALMP
jgi:hypothetical protein